MINAMSFASLAVMVFALLGLFTSGTLFSWSPLTIALQAAAVGLMIWARLTFGLRSFHATARPTAGGLVTSGPYRHIRHPIYTAACLFGWAGVIHARSMVALGLGALLFAGALGRMLCEEQMLGKVYPEYRDYARVTKRMIPNVF
jgi:protein-S-isoprenylcysteine O-methyltransferase Ste14